MPCTNDRNSRPQILLIADDRVLRSFLRSALELRGYQLAEANCGEDGLTLLAQRTPEIILLDPALPDMDGLHLLERLRHGTTIPILVLSSRDKERDKVAALDAGADDYLTKPFGVDELLARVRAIARRYRQTALPTEPDLLQFDNLEIDFARRSVLRDGEAIHLTPTEYRLLETLIRHEGKVMPHHELLGEIWGPDRQHDVQHLRVYISQLRRRIEKDPANPVWLQNVSGVGYRFMIPKK